MYNTTPTQFYHQNQINSTLIIQTLIDLGNIIALITMYNYRGIIVVLDVKQTHILVKQCHRDSKSYNYFMIGQLSTSGK